MKVKIDLEPAKKVLRTFLKEIENTKNFRTSMSLPQPALSFRVKDKVPEFDTTEFNSESNSYWEEDAYTWIYADARNYRALMHRPPPHQIPEYYSQPARLLYQQWQQEGKEVLHRKCVRIPIPADGVSLIDYLKELAAKILDDNEHRDVWIESLRSFLQFLREDTHLNQKGPLEVLFPSKESCKGMELRKGYSSRVKEEKIEQVECHYILRKIEDTVYPIDILATSEILMNLFKTVLEGRPNSQRSAAEALGFAWLCHAVGCYRLVTREELVFSTELNGFRSLDLSQSKEWFKPTHFIGVNSLFGIIDVPISKTLYDFLLALPRNPGSNRIFNMDLDVISRTLHEKGVEPSKRARHLGKITFLTFMSEPSHAIGHRTIPT
jgi:hypothetical protein